MTIKEITEMPTALSADTANYHQYRHHESLFRSFHIVGKIKDWLEMGAPPGLILELVEYMESFPQKDHQVEVTGSGSTGAARRETAEVNLAVFLASHF